MTTAKDLAQRLTELAAEVPSGSCIVELGTYHGKGTIALAKGVVQSGAAVEVYTVDDFREKRGWIGERYGPEDATIFVRNVQDAGIHATLLRSSFDDTVKWWDKPIGLLYWDPGVPGRFENDFEKWSPFIIPEGVFIAKDTAQGHLGTFPVIEGLTDSGKWEVFEYRSGVSFMRKIA